MRILSITAQKPDSTGSGVYLTELVKGFARQGHEQAVTAGVYQEDRTVFPDGVEFYPVYFCTEELPFPIAGMSDEMPYESTVYGQMTAEMVRQFKETFAAHIKEAVKSFGPDLIICHHLYLLTALVKDMFPRRKVYGFCHNTDLRQMEKTPLERKFIRKQIQKLDAIFALHEEQREEIIRIYDVDRERIRIAGTGFNSSVFYPERPERDGKLRLIFAGKLSEKKGVISLLRCLRHLPWESGKMELLLAGGYGNEEEYAQIKQLAGEAPCPVHFLGRISQEELAKAYNRSDIFVLPSFFDGMPLTMIEAMACGDKVVITELPGIRPWVEEHVPGAPVFFVEPPQMRNTDEPVREALPEFEKRLAEKIVECAAMKDMGQPDLSRVSWENVCRTVLEEYGKKGTGNIGRDEEEGYVY